MILQKLAHLARIRRNEDGSMVIETAFVAPILLLMALGGFEVSAMVARQTELQSAAAEAAAVVRAVIPEDAASRNTVRDIVATSLCDGATQTTLFGRATCGNTSVGVGQRFRCGTSSDYAIDVSGCGSATVYKFIRVNIQDTYTPLWTKFGVGSPLHYNISRTVQIG